MHASMAHDLDRAVIKSGKSNKKSEIVTRLEEISSGFAEMVEFNYHTYAAY